MKNLIAYYTRTKTTKKVADEIAKQINCESDEIIDKKKRSGPLGYITSGRDAMKKSLTEIEAKKDPSKYDLVIIGTPIWGWTMCPAVRTYITRNKFNKVAFFCTHGSSGGDKTFKEMEEITKIKPLATLELTTKEVIQDDYKEKVRYFVKKL